MKKDGWTKTRKLAKTVADECIALRVRFLSRVITSLYDRALQPLGIKINQATILVFLELSGESGPSDIGDFLQMEKSTVSRNLERMRKKGWIGVRSGADGVSQVITMTAKGRKLLAAFHKEWVKAQEKASKLLGGDGVAAVGKLHDILIRRRQKIRASDERVVRP
jgi:DNA-binding MarR family transcriptional regulator